MSKESPISVNAVIPGRLPSEEELHEISTSLRGMRFGSINIVVQDGVIVQIDRTEKKRLRTNRVHARSKN